jgi:hypothetical protein
MLRSLTAIAAAALVLATPVVAHAFCGFYVAPNDKPLYNDASMVALMRAGTRTALSMSNTYKGPPEDFAMVVPVPVVLQKENVRTLPLDLFAKLETLTAPRLVEYWEQDPCLQSWGDGIGLGTIGGLGHGAGTGTGMGYGGGTVTVEAQFTVGEYEIVILSATESDALETWLANNHYKIPAGASAALAPYVKEQQKFFVAKVDSKKVKRDDKGVVTLSPLRFTFESTDFRLPVRLGLLNSTGAQDLLVFILAETRYEVANYPNVFVPTNLDVIEDTQKHFGAFYARLFDATLGRAGGKAVVTEYAWPPQSCDPCPGPNVVLSGNDRATLGSDVVHPTSTKKIKVVKMIETGTDIVGKLPPEVVKRIMRANFPRLRVCYEAGLKKNPELSGIVSTSFEIDSTGAVQNAKSGKSTLSDEGVVTCVRTVLASLSFPEPEGGKVKVTYPIDFRSEETSAASQIPDLVITRLHTRYSPATLGDDLVFRSAPAIVGGREVRDEKGAIELSAKPASANSFQARYAIRHAWTGPMKCDKPVRGRWGGPPSGTTPAEPTAAKDLAHADRAAVTLAGYVTSGLDDVASYDKAAATVAVAKAAEPKIEPTPIPVKRACGCEIPRPSSSGEGAVAGAIVLLGLIRRVRRR